MNVMAQLDILFKKLLTYVTEVKDFSGPMSLNFFSFCTVVIFGEPWCL